MNRPPIVVYYGTRQRADRWARKNRVNPRAVILATNPNGLRGLSGPVRTVKQMGWQDTLSPNAGARANETTLYASIVAASGRMNITEEWD